VDQLAITLQSQSAKFAAVLSGGLDTHRLFRLAVECVQKTPRLMECLTQAPETVVSALLTAAEHGLEVGGSLGHGYLVPIWSSERKRMEASFWKGYRGVIYLLVRSDVVSDVEAHVVYEHDVLDLVHGTDARVTYRPCLDPAVRGEPIGAIALYTLASGKVRGHYLPREHFDRVRDAVEARNKGKLPAVWSDWWEDAWKKTVVMHGAKYLPLGPQHDRVAAGAAMATDHPDMVDLGEVTTITPAITPASAPSSTPPSAPSTTPAQLAEPSPAVVDEEPPDEAPPARGSEQEVPLDVERKLLIDALKQILSGREREDPVMVAWKRFMADRNARSWDDVSTVHLAWLEQLLISTRDQVGDGPDGGS
jgi:recombination protein RecT